MSYPVGPIMAASLVVERQKYPKSFCSRLASRDRERSSVKDAQHLLQEMACDPWPVAKSRCGNDTVLAAAQVLVRARNAELVNECNNAITLLPASGAFPGVQGGSREKSLYSLRSPKIEPFKVHLWQIPAVPTWNRTTHSWNLIPGKIMVRRGLKSEPFTHLLKTLGVAKSEAKMSDLCKHFRCWRLLKAHGGWLNEYPRHLREVVYQRWWSFNGFLFLELPPELREIILTFAMGLVAVPFTPANRYPHLTTPNMRLSLVSKQLNREVTATLLAHTTFYFHNIPQFLKFFRSTSPMSRAMIRPIKSLELDLVPYDLLRLFRVSPAFDVPCFAHDLDVLFNDVSPLCHHICIKFQQTFQHRPRPGRTSCQKMHNLAFWAGARARLRNIAVVELTGHIEETQKEEWLAEHALERKGVIPEAKGFEGWQRGIWTQW